MYVIRANTRFFDSDIVDSLTGQRDVSIVSEISGTTRDIIENYLDLRGWKVRVSDTAGLKSIESTHDEIEIEGIKRAHER